MRCYETTKRVVLAGVLSMLPQIASGGIVSNISLDTTPLVGHPALPFSVIFVFTDGDGIGDGNNTVIISNIVLGGGNALGSPLAFGGATGSLTTGITITDSSFLSLFTEQFSPGLQLSFSLELTSNSDGGGIPDRLTFSILDNSGVLLPTLAPFGDYFLGVDLGSTGPIFDVYGSDPSRAPTVGNPISIAAPTLAAVNAVPEPSTMCLLGGVLLTIVVLSRCFRHSRGRNAWREK